MKYTFKSSGETKLLNTRGKLRNWSSQEHFIKSWINDENPEIEFAVIENERLKKMKTYDDVNILSPDIGYSCVFMIEGRPIKRQTLPGFNEENKGEVKKMASQILARIPLEDDYPVIDEVQEEKYGYWFRNRGRSTNLPVFSNALTGTDIIVHPKGDMKMFSLSSGRGYSQYDTLIERSTKKERRKWMRSHPYF